VTSDEDTTMSTDDARRLGCPVVSTDYTLERPLGWYHHDLDELREVAPVAWNDSTYGFWMFTRFDEVREALTTPEVFSNERTSALGDPRVKPRLLPQNLDGAEHMAYRHVLNPWFSPSALARTEPLLRRRCREMIEALAPRGECDLAVELAMELPTEIFLAHLGLPPEDGPMLLPLVEAMFRGFFGGDPGELADTVERLKAYFRDHLDDRRRQRRDPATDFLSYLLDAEVLGAPLEPEDAVTLAFTIMLAGLDTTRSALGYAFHHLATHPDDRARLVAEPGLIPTAVEELIRAFPLLLQVGRLVTQDVEFHGCPLRAGDIVWLGLASANRDPRQFPDADHAVLGREANRHVGFGMGAHRCLGSHLARKELAIVIEEWLRLIPDFELDPTVEIRERGGQLMLRTVPLRWTTR
jgi:cytochrome P450